jgi:hypothetical protein
MESWRRAWREGFGKVLPLDGLKSLAEALRVDDERLHQGATTTPPPLMCVEDWPCEGADAIGWTKFKGDTRVTVGEVERHFQKMCFDADTSLGGPAECRWFLNWFDDTPRDAMRRELLAEVERSIREREGVSCGST